MIVRDIVRVGLAATVFILALKLIVNALPFEGPKKLANAI